MNIDRSEFLVSLGKFAAAVTKDVGPNNSRCYPVLGAEGGDFFIEISSGPDFMHRRICKTIYASFDASTNLGKADAEEVMVTLPDASYLVALLSLLQKALNTTDTKILHPLDHCGNYLPTWNQAVIAASPGTSS